VCWIPVEDEESEFYRTRKEAQQDLDQMSLMQPENIYRILKVSPEKKPER
jgi:formylmethanofuran dehydrogenase subunit E